MANTKTPETPAGVYALIDSLGFRICAAWQLLPAPVRYSESLFDQATHIAITLANDTPTLDVMSRLRYLRDNSLVHVDGTIDPLIRDRIERSGRRMMGLSEDADEPTGEPTDEPADDVDDTDGDEE